MAVILIIKTEDGEITELPLLSKITIGRSKLVTLLLKLKQGALMQVRKKRLAYLRLNQV